MCRHYTDEEVVQMVIEYNDMRDEIAELKKRNYHLENTRLKESSAIQLNAMKKMFEYFDMNLQYPFSIADVYKYAEQLRKDNKPN